MNAHCRYVIVAVRFIVSVCLCQRVSTMCGRLSNICIVPHSNRVVNTFPAKKVVVAVKVLFVQVC